MIKIHCIILFIFLNLFNKAYCRGITSKVGASCIFVASNFTSFPFDCQMPDLAFNCRCQDPSFLGTVTNCIESHSKHPDDLSNAYNQLINTCKAQGGKSWDLIDLIKINQNSSNYLMDFDHIPNPKFKSNLVWKAQKIFNIQMNNNNLLTNNNNNNNINNNKKSPIIFDPYANDNSYSSQSLHENERQLEHENESKGMIQNGKVLGFEKIPKFDNIKEIEKIGIENILSTERFILHNPVIVPENLYNISFNSVSKLIDQRNLATTYGLYIYLYWSFVFLIAIIVNISQWTSPYFNKKFSKTKFALWFKSKIICPQMIKPNKLIKFRSIANNTLKELTDGPIGMFIGSNRLIAQNEKIQLIGLQLLNEKDPKIINELNLKLKKIKKISLNDNKLNSKFNRNCKINYLNSIYTIPVRMHAIVIIGYLILNIVLCCINYEIIYPNSVFTCRKGQKLVSIADRTGIIGTVQLPLVYLFSTRNNIFSKITGLSYRSFQMFHKWTSRIVFILLILHCSFYLMFVNVRGDYIERWGLLKWRCANTAFAAISITMGLSFIRKLIYEWFKFSHQLLLIIFSIGSLLHCLTLGWIEYLIIAYVIWILEYIIRFGKIISSGGILKGEFNLIYDTNTNKPHSIRILINHSGWWKPFPGCYCWINILKYDMFWESHPFTVISTISPENYNQLVFIIKIKDGLTKRLSKYISKQPNNKCYINLLIEGPYGNNLPFKQYDKSILVAGGVGLSVIYSIAVDLAQIYKAQYLRGKRDQNLENISNNNNNNSNSNSNVNSNSNCSNKIISLIWIIPNFESLLTFKKEIENLQKFSELIEVQIFITRKLKEIELQEIINLNNLNNPLGYVSNIYEQEGIKGFASALIKSANQSMNNTTSRSNTDFFDNDILKEKIDNEFEQEQESGDESGNGNGNEDIENGMNNSIIIREQKMQAVNFLKWLIENNGKQISINFEDKPFLEEEICEFVVKNEVSDGSISLIACGPLQLNADVRLAAVESLKRGVCVDYYEEELLW